MERISFVMDYARRAAPDVEIEVEINENSGFTVGVHQQAIEERTYHQQNEFNVTLVHNQCAVSTSTSSMSQESIQQIIDKAYYMVKSTEPDHANGLPEKSLLAQGYPDLALSDEFELSTTKMTEEAFLLESVALSHSNQIKQVDNASVQAYRSSTILANSHGFLGHYTTTDYHRSLSVIAELEKAITCGDSMECYHDYQTARHQKRLKSIDQFSKHVAIEAIRRLNPQTVHTGKYPIIFTPSVARSLLGCFINAISGDRLYRKESFLAGTLNKKVFPKWLSISENPHQRGGAGSAPFDSDGMQLSPKHFVTGGVLRSYALSNYAARKLNMQPTGNTGGVYNVSLQSSKLLSNQDDLLVKMNRGILITDIMGHGVNLVTGDYSQGAGGFWVEHGQIQHPITGFTIAGQLQEMFANIVALSDDIDERGNIQTGSILLDEMMVAGK